MASASSSSYAQQGLPVNPNYDPVHLNVHLVPQNSSPPAHQVMAAPLVTPQLPPKCGASANWLITTITKSLNEYTQAEAEQCDCISRYIVGNEQCCCCCALVCCPFFIPIFLLGQHYDKKFDEACSKADDNLETVTEAVEFNEYSIQELNAINDAYNSAVGIQPELFDHEIETEFRNQMILAKQRAIQSGE